MKINFDQFKISLSLKDKEIVLSNHKGTSVAFNVDADNCELVFQGFVSLKAGNSQYILEDIKSVEIKDTPELIKTEPIKTEPIKTEPVKSVSVNQNDPMTKRILLACRTPKDRKAIFKEALTQDEFLHFTRIDKSLRSRKYYNILWEQIHLGFLQVHSCENSRNPMFVLTKFGEELL